jgi:ankyrin repeat protein
LDENYYFGTSQLLEITEMGIQNKFVEAKLKEIFGMNFPGIELPEVQQIKFDDVKKLLRFLLRCINGIETSVTSRIKNSDKNLFHYLALTGYAQGFREYLEIAKDKLIERSAKQRYPLHYAAIGESEEIIDIYITELNKIEGKANHVGINLRDYKQRTPLHYAVLSGSTAIIEKLISHEASLLQRNIVDFQELSPIHYAVSSKSYKVLLACQLPSENINNFVRYSFADGHSLLNLLIKNDMFDTLGKFMSLEVDMNFSDANTKTALNIAVKKLDKLMRNDNENKQSLLSPLVRFIDYLLTQKLKPNIAELKIFKQYVNSHETSEFIWKIVENEKKKDFTWTKYSIIGLTLLMLSFGSYLASTHLSINELSHLALFFLVVGIPFLGVVCFVPYKKLIKAEMTIKELIRKSRTLIRNRSYVFSQNQENNELISIVDIENSNRQNIPRSSKPHYKIFLEEFNNSGIKLNGLQNELFNFLQNLMENLDKTNNHHLGKIDKNLLKFAIKLKDFRSASEVFKICESINIFLGKLIDEYFKNTTSQSDDYPVKCLLLKSQEELKVFVFKNFPEEILREYNPPCEAIEVKYNPISVICSSSDDESIEDASAYTSNGEVIIKMPDL